MPTADVDGVESGPDYLGLVWAHPERASATAIVSIVVSALVPVVGILALGWQGTTVLVALWCEGVVAVIGSCVRVAIVGHLAGKLWGDAVLRRSAFACAMLGSAAIPMVLFVPGWPPGEHGTLWADFVAHVDWRQVGLLALLALLRYGVWVGIDIAGAIGDGDHDPYGLDRSAVVLGLALFGGLFVVGILSIGGGLSGSLAGWLFCAVVIVRSAVELVWSRPRVPVRA